jgi:hypothetical protein
MLEQYWTRGKVQEYMYDETNPLLIRINELVKRVEALEKILESQTPSGELDS